MTIEAFFPNLPVTDLPRAVAFYEALGFAVNPQFTNEVGASIVLSDTASLMLVTHGFFGENTPRAIADAHATTEVLLAIRLASRKAVDDMANAALAAGGTESRAASDLGFMYGRSFSDPDGHIWEPFWMDPAGPPADAA